MSDSKQRPRRPPMRRGFNDGVGAPSARRPPMGRSGPRTDPPTGQSSQTQPAQQRQQPASAQSGAPGFPLVTPAGTTVPFYPPPGQGGQVFIQQVPLQFPQAVTGQQVMQAQLNPTASSGSAQNATAPTSGGDQAPPAGAGGPPRRPPIVNQNQQQPRPQYVMSQEQFKQMQQSGQIMIPQQVLVQAPQMAGVSGVPIVPMTGAAQAAPAVAASAAPTATSIPVSQPAATQPEVAVAGPSATEAASNVAQPPAAAESPKRRGQPWGNKTKPTVFGWATVRQVLSGHSLQLEIKKYYKREQEFTLPSQLITLLLDCIQCPSIGRRKKVENAPPNTFEFEEDEPFAFEAKEFARKSLLQASRFGTDPVIFAAWQILPSSKTSKIARYYGDIYIVGKDGGAPRSLSLLMVQSGWGKLKMLQNQSRVPGSLDRDEYERLKNAFQDAQSRGVGQNQGNDAKHKRNMVYTTQYREVLLKYGQDEMVDAVVDYVVDACTLRVEICPSDDLTVERESSLLVRLAGVRSIDTQKEDNDQLRQYADEAKSFVERALLDQDVKIRFVSADDRNLYAQVIHPSGRRIAVALLYQGYAEMLQWSAKEIRDATEITEMKQAQQRARDQKVKLWKYKSVPQEDDEGEMVIVTRVLSGDKLEVRYHNGNNAREMVRLSSIRAPTRAPVGDRNGEWRDEPWFREAKEFLRSKTIGKVVLMHKDYEREQKQNDSGGMTNRQVYASIYLQSGENVAESLLRKGLAKIIQRGSKDDPSRDYIKLFDAFEQAKKSGAFKLNRKEDNASQPLDFSALDRPQSSGSRSGGKKQQKQSKKKGGGRPRNVNERSRIELFNKLKNSDRRVKCVVEMIFSPTKFKLYVEQQNAFITFQLSHIRCEPAPPRKERSMNYVPGRATNNPGLDAIRYVNDQLMQREVHIQVLETENNTNLKGNLFYNGNKNVAEELLERGLARVYTWVPPRLRAGQRPIEAPPSYLQIEETAKAAKIGGWNRPSEEMDEENEDAKTTERREFGEEIQIVISHIQSATEFWANREEHSQLMDQVAAELDAYEAVPLKRPKPGRIYVGKYNGVWARCELIKKNVKRTDSSVPTWFVTFIDYGNRASLTEENLGKCPRQLSDLDAFPPLAFKCQLAGMQSPHPKDFSTEFNMAGEYFASLVLPQTETQSKVLKFKVLFDTAAWSKFHRSNRMQPLVKWGELFDKEMSINKVLARDGYAMLDRADNLRSLTEQDNEETKQYVQTIRRLKDEAISNHLNIWHRGDVFGDDEDEQ